MSSSFEMLPAALEGDEVAARRYARAWRARVREIVEAHPGAPAVTADLLDSVAVSAAVDPRGPEGALMSAAAGIIGDMEPVTGSLVKVKVPQPADFRRFSRVVLAELSGLDGAVERLLDEWRLSVTELGALFGVSRQAVQQWVGGGVPASRQPKLLVVLQIADLLALNLIADRVPGAVRTRARAYGGMSVLEMIAADRHDDLLRRVARSFDWAATA